jgi:hypothetical protein
MKPLRERLTAMGMPVGNDWTDESTSAREFDIRGLEVATKDPAHHPGKRTIARCLAQPTGGGSPERVRRR